MIVNARFLCQKITGVQRYAIELSKELKRLEPSFSFVAPKNILHKELARELDAFSFGSLTGHFWEQIELPVFMKRNNSPFLLNLANTAPLVYPKNFFTIHDLAFQHHPEWFSRKFSLAYKLMLPYLSKRALRIFTVSDYSKSDIVKSYAIEPSKIDVVYNAVSSSLFPERGVTSNVLSSKPYILCVGSLDPRKNLSRLVQAFSLIEGDIELLVVGGKGRMFADSNLDDLVRSDSRVKFLGYVPDEELRKLYSRAVAFVYPSLYEGFGIPTIEAQALGCPVISSASTSLPEVLGESAVFCDPHDVRDISDKIKLLIDDSELRKRVRELGYRNSSKYSWGMSAQVLLNGIKEFL